MYCGILQLLQEGCGWVMYDTVRQTVGPYELDNCVKCFKIGYRWLYFIARNTCGGKRT